MGWGLELTFWCLTVGRDVRHVELVCVAARCVSPSGDGTVFAFLPGGTVYWVRVGEGSLSIAISVFEKIKRTRGCNMIVIRGRSCCSLDCRHIAEFRKNTVPSDGVVDVWYPLSPW